MQRYNCLNTIHLQYQGCHSVGRNEGTGVISDVVGICVVGSPVGISVIS